MMRIKFMLPLLAAMTIATTAQAKTLVFCSEGSPEGFDPALYTTGTTFDVSPRDRCSANSSNSSAARPISSLA